MNVLILKYVRHELTVIILRFICFDEDFPFKGKILRM